MEVLSRSRATPLGRWERILMFPMRLIPTGWLIKVLASRHDTYLIVTMNTANEKKVVGGKDDGMRKFELGGQIHWRGTQVEMATLLSGTSEDVSSQFKSPDAPPQYLDKGGIMTGECDEGD